MSFDGTVEVDVEKEERSCCCFCLIHVSFCAGVFFASRAPERALSAQPRRGLEKGTESESDGPEHLARARESFQLKERKRKRKKSEGSSFSKCFFFFFASIGRESQSASYGSRCRRSPPFDPRPLHSRAFALPPRRPALEDSPDRARF